MEGGFPMLNKIKSAFDQQRERWSRETRERIKAYEEEEKMKSIQRMKKEEAMNQLLHRETEKYLETIHPSYLLHPDAEKILRQKLIAYGEGRSYFTFSLNSEVRLTQDFYKSDLIYFIRLLEKKGFVMKGNEERFVTTLLNKLSENNYLMYLDRYGNFVKENDTLQNALYKYLELVEEGHTYDSGRLDFLNKYLIYKGLLTPDFTKKKLKKMIKQLEKQYHDQYKLTRLEKRINNIS